jgi:hypothetical protein
MENIQKLRGKFGDEGEPLERHTNFIGDDNNESDYPFPDFSNLQSLLSAYKSITKPRELPKKTANYKLPIIAGVVAAVAVVCLICKCKRNRN